MFRAGAAGCGLFVIGARGPIRSLVDACMLQDRAQDNYSIIYMPENDHLFIVASLLLVRAVPVSISQSASGTCFCFFFLRGVPRHPVNLNRI